MKTKKYIKSTLYNRRDQGSITMIELRSKIASLNKQRGWLNKNVSELLSFSFDNYWDKKSCESFCSPSKSLFTYCTFLPDASIEEIPFEKDYKAFLEELFFHKIETSINLSDRFFSFESPKVCNSTKDRAGEINHQLRELKSKAKLNPTKDLFLKIKKLVQELHSLVIFFYRKSRNSIKQFAQFLDTGCRTDFRRLYREKVRTLFKYFSDFSGSEEEERNAHRKVSTKIFFDFKTKKKCLTKNNYSILLINGLKDFNLLLLPKNSSFYTI